jgi:hypothetical protein
MIGKNGSQKSSSGAFPPLCSPVCGGCFFCFFYFIYGMILLWIVGGRYHLIILALASATAVGFTVAVVLLLYRGFKAHILGDENQ